MDLKSHVQKSVINTGRAQPLASALTRSVAKANAVAEKFSAVQFMAPLSDSESEIDEFPHHPNITSHTQKNS